MFKNELNKLNFSRLLYCFDKSELLKTNHYDIQSLECYFFITNENHNSEC